MKSVFCLLAALLLLSVNLGAQDNALPPSVTKGRLITAGGEKLTFSKLTTGSDLYTFSTSTASKTQTIPAENVLRIEQQTGTEAGKWALMMGGAGLLGSVLGVLSAKNDASSLGVETDNSKLMPIVLGLTAASTLIGLAIGSGKKKYKTVYTNPKYDTSAHFAPIRINLVFTPQGRAGLALHCRF